MQIRLDAKLKAELVEISIRDIKLSRRIQKQLTLFAINPKHKSLRVHKLSGELESMWSISITKSVRMSYLKSGEEVYFFDIGTHDEVYRKR